MFLYDLQLTVVGVSPLATIPSAEHGIDESGVHALHKVEVVRGVRQAVIGRRGVHLTAEEHVTVREGRPGEGASVDVASQAAVDVELDEPGGE